MHPEINLKPALKIAGTPTSKGAHTKQRVSTSKGVQEQPIVTSMRSREFSPSISLSNLQHNYPVDYRTRYRLRAVHLITLARA